MDEAHIFVIGIYRQANAGVDGIIEAVSGGARHPFHSSDEPWEALRRLCISPHDVAQQTVYKEDRT